MGDSTRVPVQLQGDLVCIEVSRGTRGGEACLAVVLSIPGRDGTVTRSWQTPTGVPDSGQVDDVIVWVLKALRTAIADRWSVQEVMQGFESGMERYGPHRAT